MPLLESFSVDHTKMKAPAVRLGKKMNTKHGDIVSVYDLRFCMPNKEIMGEKGIHTIEHLFAGFMRKYLNSNSIEIIDISPMGCRTGFYMSLLGEPKEEEIIKAWTNSMEEVLRVQDQSQIPELNEQQCGTYTLHSLEEAKEIAKNVLERGIAIMHSEDLRLN